MQIPHPGKRVRDDSVELSRSLRTLYGLQIRKQFAVSTNFMGPIVVQIFGASFKSSLITIVAPQEDY